MAQPYRSTGAPPKRLAAQSLRRSPKRRVGGPNATTTVLGPRSQGGNATTTVQAMHPASPSSAATDDSDAAEGLPLPPSRDPATDYGEVRLFPNCRVTEGSGVDPEGPEALPSTGPLDPETEPALPAPRA